MTAVTGAVQIEEMGVAVSAQPHSVPSAMPVKTAAGRTRHGPTTKTMQASMGP